MGEGTLRKQFIRAAMAFGYGDANVEVGALGLPKDFPDRYVCLGLAVYRGR